MKKLLKNWKNTYKNLKQKKYATRKLIDKNLNND